MKGPDTDLGNSECRGEGLNPERAVPDRPTVSFLTPPPFSSGLSEREGTMHTWPPKYSWTLTTVSVISTT